MHFDPTKDYKVQQGDTASSIATAHGITLAQLQALNPGVDLSALLVSEFEFRLHTHTHTYSSLCCFRLDKCLFIANDVAAEQKDKQRLNVLIQKLKFLKEVFWVFFVAEVEGINTDDDQLNALLFLYSQIAHNYLS